MTSMTTTPGRTGDHTYRPCRGRRTALRRRIMCLASTGIAASFAAGMVFGAPAYADPVSGTSTTVEMPMPGADQSSSSGSAYQPPSVSITTQDGTGGIDRDGTNGVIDPDGTNGRVTGPLVRATPVVLAAPAPMSPHVPS